MIIAGWVLVGLLAIIIVVRIVNKLFDLAFWPVREINSAIAASITKYQISRVVRPRSSAEKEAYLQWANGEGEFGSYQSWQEAQFALYHKLKQDAARAKLRVEQEGARAQKR